MRQQPPGKTALFRKWASEATDGISACLYTMELQELVRSKVWRQVYLLQSGGSLAHVPFGRTSGTPKVRYSPTLAKRHGIYWLHPLRLMIEIMESEPCLAMGYAQMCGLVFRIDLVASSWLPLSEHITHIIIGVSEVYEFFNSTEGMLALGIWSRSGFGRATVGHHGLLLRLLMHGTYIPVMLDPNTGDVWRDPGTGFAKRVSYDKGGEILVKIPDTEAFPGYFKAEKETNKKFANDVFKKGDLYYRTGDALRRTDDGFWYFLDRLGEQNL